MVAPIGRRMASVAAPVPPVWQVAVETAPQTTVTLVLGLQWHTILGRDLARQARRRASREAASHWVHAAGRAEVVGVLPRAAGPVAVAARSAHAAAQAFARLAGEGTHVASLSVPTAPGGWWLALVRDGQVLNGGDRCLEDGSAASACWASWRARHGASWRVWGEPPAAAATSAEPACTPLAWSQLAATVGADSLLQVLPRWRGPASVGVAAAMLVAVATATAAWWRADPATRPVVPAAGVAASPDVAQAAWAAAAEAWRTRTRLLTAHGLDQLAQTLLDVPARVAGWQLLQAACAVRADSGWDCHASYRRAHRLGRQAGLLAQLPSAWTLQWQGLEEARAHWVVQPQTAAIAWSALTPSTTSWVADADVWLTLAPLWQRVEWGRREVVALAPAAVGEPPVVPPRPSHMPELAQRSLVVSGPLRSFSLIPTALTQRTEWQRVALQVAASSVAPTRLTSSLILTLQGVVHESSYR